MEKKLNKEEMEELMKLTAKFIGQKNDWRLGQTLFNCLYDLFPDVADRIRGTNKDPFYNNDLIKEFLEEILEESVLAEFESRYIYATYPRGE